MTCIVFLPPETKLPNKNVPSLKVLSPPSASCTTSSPINPSLSSKNYPFPVKLQFPNLIDSDLFISGCEILYSGVGRPRIGMRRSEFFFRPLVYQPAAKIYTLLAQRDFLHRAHAGKIGSAYTRFMNNFGVRARGLFLFFFSAGRCTIIYWRGSTEECRF